MLIAKLNRKCRTRFFVTACHLPVHSARNSGFVEKSKSGPAATAATARAVTPEAHTVDELPAFYRFHTGEGFEQNADREPPTCYVQASRQQRFDNRPSGTIRKGPFSPGSTAKSNGSAVSICVGVGRYYTTASGSEPGSGLSGWLDIPARCEL